MNARYRPEGGKSTRFVHTLNGSGVAVGRALGRGARKLSERGRLGHRAAVRPYMGGAREDRKRKMSDGHKAAIKKLGRFSPRRMTRR